MLVSVLEHHPCSVGLGAFDVGFCQWLWVVSQCPGLVLPVPCSSLLSYIRLLNAWYASASFQFSLAAVILDSQGYSSWNEL